MNTTREYQGTEWTTEEPAVAMVDHDDEPSIIETWFDCVTFVSVCKLALMFLLGD